MDFWTVLARRRSVRSFLKKPVADKDIKSIVGAAYLAPSAGDQKNWRIIAVKDDARREAMRRAVVNRIDELARKMKSPRAKKEFLSYSRYFTFFADAPVVIAIVMTPYDSLTGRILARVEGNKTYTSTAGLQSVSAAFENMLLAAEALDLGTCWMTGPMLARAELEKVLNVNPPDQLTALTPVGYPKSKPASHKLSQNVRAILKWM